MHESGYSFLTLPKLHASERRVLAEGKRVRSDIQEQQIEHRRQESGHARKNAEGDLIGEHRRRKTQQKSRASAIEQYAENNPNVGDIEQPW